MQNYIPSINDIVLVTLNPRDRKLHKGRVTDTFGDYIEVMLNEAGLIGLFKVHTKGVKRVLRKDHSMEPFIDSVRPKHTKVRWIASGHKRSGEKVERRNHYLEMLQKG